MLLFDCINHDKSKADLISDGQIIRTSYLLADAVRVSGTTYMGIAAEEQFAAVDGWLKKKMILDYAARVPDPNYLEEVKKIYEALSNGRKNVKHENKDMIVARKRIEKTLDQILAASIQELMNAFATCGYTGLMPLVKEDSLRLWPSYSEKPEYAANDAVPYSEILKIKWQEEDEVYCITEIFMEYMREHNLVFSPFDEADENAGALIFPLPDLPLLNSLSAAELKTVKQEVFGDLQPLRTAIEEWSQQLKAENFSAASFSQYTNYFTSSLTSHLQTAEAGIARSALLEKINTLVRGQVGYHNYLAVTSAKTCWSMMEWSGMVPKQSMHVFEENLPQGCDGDKAVLLFINQYFNHQKAEEAGDKKSLQL